MSYAKLSDAVSVSGQISADELATIQSTGFVGIVNNRPDGEMPGQPKAADMAEKATGLGLTYTHIPVTSPPFSESDIAAFKSVLETAKGPVLAHCKSGMRSTCLWALSQADQIDPQTLINAAANAGFDISGLAPLLAARHAG